MLHSIQECRKRFFSKLYDCGNRLLGKIDKSLRKGSKIKDDHYEKDSEKVCGKPQADSRHLGFYAGIRRPDHLQIVKDGNTGIDDRQNDQCVHVLFNCSGKQEKLTGKPYGGRDTGHAEGTDSQGESQQRRTFV